MTPAGMEPATFRFVAQHFNYCATAVPIIVTSIIIIVTIIIQHNTTTLHIHKTRTLNRHNKNSMAVKSDIKEVWDTNCKLRKTHIR